MRTATSPLQRPFLEAAVLEQASAVQVVLADRVTQPKNAPLGHRVLLARAMPGKAKGVFVAVNMLVEEFGSLVVPVAES